MSIIEQKINSLNCKGEKALTIFLTAGYPNVEDFSRLALRIIDAGADILEIGLPFADSLADGPIIQSSYIEALKQNVNLTTTFEMIAEIRANTDIPLILMSSSNPILNYGKVNFTEDAKQAGVNGVIIPDVPLEEYDNFFENSFVELDKIMLTTPTSSEERIKMIDMKSSGFLYCVSVVGTTGVRQEFDSYVLENLERTYKLTNSKMQIGFGISSEKDVKRFSPFCDGVIVGSAIVKSIANNSNNYSETIELVKELKEACKL
ncbi:MAG: tryptophan synthase subunit alpha [Ignavibacteriae bacterium]|nr:tryptophan synthase subunit alpha [Ignavibacteriota bacterium]